MVDAAKSEAWEDVVRFEGLCAVLIEQLRAKAREEELSPEHRSEKTRIMKRILLNDAQIRLLVEPWLTHCEDQMDGVRRLLH